MTSQQAADALTEVVLFEGGRVLLDFRIRAADDPEIEADVIRTMLEAEDTDGDICAAVSDYAHASGLSATYYLGREALIIALGTPAGA